MKQMKNFIAFAFILTLLVGCTPKEKVSEVADYSLPSVEDVVIYQINPRVFAPSNSFNAVVPLLDSIKDLGANIVWFMPIYEIGEINSKNSPYSIKNYRSINPEFGTLEDFKNLIVEAHKKGLGIIIDFVPNHTAWDHPWVEANKDWYTQDSLGNIIYPADTDWTDVADLNFDNQEMRLAMIEEMKYWATEVGIDGFRCDAVDYVPADFLKQCNDSLKAIPGKELLLLAEGARKDHFNSGFDLNYAWEFADQMRKVFQKGEVASTLFTTNESEYEGVEEGHYKLRFTTNHDESFKHSPLSEWVNQEGSMAAFATISFFPGCAMVYGSQEVGYPNPINFFEYVEMDWSANPELKKEYANIIRIRDAHNALKRGKINAYPNDNILLFERISDDETCLVAINTRNEVQEMELPENLINREFINLYTNENIELKDKLTLNAFEYLILQ